MIIKGAARGFDWPHTHDTLSPPPRTTWNPLRMASVVSACRPFESARSLASDEEEKAPAMNMWKLATCVFMFGRFSACLIAIKRRHAHICVYPHYSRSGHTRTPSPSDRPKTWPVPSSV